MVSYTEYLQEHSHPANLALHVAGVWTALLLALASALGHIAMGCWWVWGFALLGVAWAFVLSHIGHLVHGNRPVAYRSPWVFLVTLWYGVRMGFDFKFQAERLSWK